MPPETPGTTPQEPETLRFAGQAAVPANPCHDRRSSNTSPLLSEELANDLRAVRSPMPDSSARSILEQSKTPSIEISLALPQEENQNQSCKLRGKTVECFPFRRQQQPAMSSLVTTNTLTARRCVLVEFFLAKALSPCSAARLAECGSLQSRHKSVDDRGDEAFAELPYPATGLAERCSGTQGRQTSLWKLPAGQHLSALCEMLSTAPAWYTPLTACAAAFRLLSFKNICTCRNLQPCGS